MSLKKKVLKDVSKLKQLVKQTLSRLKSFSGSRPESPRELVSILEPISPFILDERDVNDLVLAASIEYVHLSRQFPNSADLIELERMIGKVACTGELVVPSFAESSFSPTAALEHWLDHIKASMSRTESFFVIDTNNALDVVHGLRLAEILAIVILNSRNRPPLTPFELNRLAVLLHLGGTVASSLRDGFSHPDQNFPSFLSSLESTNAILGDLLKTNLRKSLSVYGDSFVLEASLINFLHPFLQEGIFFMSGWVLSDRVSGNWGSFRAIHFGRSLVLIGSDSGEVTEC